MSYQQADYYGGQQQGYYQQQGAAAAPQYQQYNSTGYGSAGGKTDQFGHQLPATTPMGSPVYGKNHEIIYEGEPFYPDCQDPELQRRFRTGGWKDLPWAILFYVHLIVVIIVAIVNIKSSKFSSDIHNAQNDINTANNNNNATTVDVAEQAKIFGKAAGASFGISIAFTSLFLMLMKMFPATFIWIAQGFVLLIWVAYIGFGVYLGATILIVFGIIFLLLTCLWLYMVKNQIPFSALLLEMSSGVVMKYPSTMVFGFVALVVGIIYYVFWVLMTVPTIAKFQDNNVNYEATGGLCFIFLVLFYWTQALLQAIVHITTGGTIATYFFCGSVDRMPPNPTVASFKRAMTTSFGSACLGSLIIGILRAIEAMARAAYRRNRNSIGACIALCVIQCIENLMQWFNEYAFSRIAIDGSSYIEAAKSTWDMVMNGSIFTGIISNILVNRVFVLITVFEALLCGVICFFAFNKEAIAAVAGVLVAIVVSVVMLHPVASGVTTFIVAISMAPEVWLTRHPELAQKISHAIKELRKGCCDGEQDDGQP